MFWLHFSIFYTYIFFSGCEQREYLQIAGGVGASGNNCSSNCGSLHRRHHPIGSDQGGRNSSGGGGTTSAQQPPRRITTTHIHGGSGAGHNHGTLNRGGGGCPNSADHPSLLRRSSSGTTASSGIRQHGGGGLHHQQQQQIVGTLPRSVRFEDVVLTAPVTSESHGLLDHDSMPLPLQPPATFSDPPPPPPEQQPPQLSLRPELRLQPLATNENAINHESSVCFFLSSLSKTFYVIFWFQIIKTDKLILSLFFSLLPFVLHPTSKPKQEMLSMQHGFRLLAYCLHRK